MLRTFKKHRLTLFVAAVLSGTVSLANAAAEHAPTTQSIHLVTVRQNAKMPWNAVAVDAHDRFIVGAPRWTGNAGPAVAIVEKNGTLKPYPDASWNNWKPSSDASHVFVSVNAIHEDAHGDLWIVDTGSPEFGGTPVENGAKVVHIDPCTDTVVRVYTFPKESILAHTYGRRNIRRFKLCHTVATSLTRPSTSHAIAPLQMRRGCAVADAPMSIDSLSLP